MLKNLKILEIVQEDLSFGTRILGDLGALVVSVKQVNNSEEPDDARFLYHNINKYVLGLDIKKPEGRKILFDLAKKVDVIVTDENSSPVFENEDFRELFKANCGPSNLRIRGSPCKNGVGYPYEDIIISARSSQMYLTGNPSDPPLPLAGRQTLYTGALYIAVATLLLFCKKIKDGRGLVVDLFLEECAISVIEDVLIRFISDGIPPERNGPFSQNEHFAILPCKDGYMQMSLLYQLETLLELLGMDTFQEKDVEEKEKLWSKKKHEIIQRLKMWMKNYSCSELFDLGQAMHFPWAPVVSIGDVLQSPHLKSRKFFRKVKKTGFAKIPFVPYRIKGFRPGIKLPHRERDSLEICLKYLKISPLTFNRLKEERVI